MQGSSLNKLISAVTGKGLRPAVMVVILLWVSLSPSCRHGKQLPSNTYRPQPESLATLENKSQTSDSTFLASSPGSSPTTSEDQASGPLLSKKKNILQIAEKKARKFRNLNPADTLRKIAWQNVKTAYADFSSNKDESTGKTCLYILLGCLGIFLLTMLIGLLADGAFDNGGAQVLIFVLLILAAVVLGVRTKRRFSDPEPSKTPEEPVVPPSRRAKPQYPNPDKNPAYVLLLVGTAVFALLFIILIVFGELFIEIVDVLFPLLLLASMIIILAGLAMLEGQRRF